MSRLACSFLCKAMVVGVLAMTVWPGDALAQRPLGTDVSSHQPSINWTAVKNAGVAFAWTKATEGTYYVNPYFTSQEAGAKGVGIYIGAYHYAKPSVNPNITGANSADSEAAYFWSVAGNYVTNGGAYLVPMLDWEDTGATVAAGFTAVAMSAWVNEWCNTVSNYARLKGVLARPVVYTGTWFSSPGATYPGLTTAVTNWPSWIAAYPQCDVNNNCGTSNPQVGGPGSSYPWSTWNIWQYGNTNWSGGDSDAASGNLATFVQTFVIGGNGAPTITTPPQSLSVALGATANFNVTATGVGPLHFQWQFNQANIPGATATNYTISSAQLTNAGGYSMTVTNGSGTTVSVPAFLSVLGPLTNAPGCILAPPGLVDWWPADGNANDIFAYRNGTPQNGFSYAAGKQGLAFHFDGSSSYLSTGAADVPVPWTACFWVNRQDAPGTAAALTGNGTTELKLEQYGTTRQVGFTRFGVNDWTFGFTVPLNTWTHLAFVASGAQMILYSNGVQVGILSTNIPLPRAYIGAGYVTSGARIVDYTLGSLDEIVMFNRALSASEIAAMFAAGSAGMVRAPEFTGGGSFANGQFTSNLRGQTGKGFTIYSSTDLTTWTVLGTMSNPTGAVQFTDAIANAPQKFYRVKQP